MRFAKVLALALVINSIVFLGHNFNKIISEDALLKASVIFSLTIEDPAAADSADSISEGALYPVAAAAPDSKMSFAGLLIIMEILLASGLWALL